MSGGVREFRNLKKRFWNPRWIFLLLKEHTSDNQTRRSSRLKSHKPNVIEEDSEDDFIEGSIHSLIGTKYFRLFWCRKGIKWWSGSVNRWTSDCDLAVTENLEESSAGEASDWRRCQLWGWRRRTRGINSILDL